MKTFEEFYDKGGVGDWVMSIDEPFTPEQIRMVAKVTYNYARQESRNDLNQLSEKIAQTIREVESTW